MSKKIKLRINGNEKVYYQPSFIKGKAIRVGMRVAEKLETLETGIPDDELLDELLQFVAEYGYDGQFTADELENGLDARDMFEELAEQLSSVMSRSNNEGKPTSAKKD